MHLGMDSKAASGFRVGQRIAVDEKYLGTIRFIGPVTGTSGVWLGIEWDDAGRGKHSGAKGGQRYFDVDVPGSASFIRPSSRVFTGRSFVEALKAKYSTVSDDHPDKEDVQVFSDSSLPIYIVSVGLEKTRKRMADWRRLRDIGFERSCICRAGEEDELALLRTDLANVTSVDLSDNLLTDFDECGKIASALPGLQTLVLNGNRLAPEATGAADFSTLQHVQYLHLSRTSLGAEWSDMTRLLAGLPHLERLDASACGIRSLDAPPLVSDCTLQHLNLAENRLDDWSDLFSSLSNLPRLRKVDLSSNRLPDIESSPSVSLPTVEALNVSSNAIASWKTVHLLASAFPSMRRLSMYENPLTANGDETATRLLTIARIPTLTILENSEISRAERAEAERFYWARIGKESGTDSEKEERHPRFRELQGRFGESAEEGARGSVPPSTLPQTMKSRLITLRILASPAPLNPTLSVLPTMTVRVLRAKLQKALGRPCGKSAVQLWALLGRRGEEQRADDDRRDRVEEHAVRAEMDDDGREVGWYGLESADAIEVV